METKQANSEWGLVHTPNGEWIYDFNVVYVSKVMAGLAKVLANTQDLKLTVHKESDDLFWCYKHEFEAIDFDNIGTHATKRNNEQ